MSADSNALQTVANSLERINSEINISIAQMAKSMTEASIIQAFNQVAIDLFVMVEKIILDIKKDKEYKLDSYRILFDNAIRINNRLPIDKFTLIVLEYAPEIYSKDENCFLKMSIPDKNISIGNTFGFIRSEMFKNLWIILPNNHKKVIIEKVISLTTYAHAYFYKTDRKSVV